MSIEHFCNIFSFPYKQSIALNGRARIASHISWVTAAWALSGKITIMFFHSSLFPHLCVGWWQRWWSSSLYRPIADMQRIPSTSFVLYWWNSNTFHDFGSTVSSILTKISIIYKIRITDSALIQNQRHQTICCISDWFTAFFIEWQTFNMFLTF